MRKSRATRRCPSRRRRGRNRRRCRPVGSAPRFGCRLLLRVSQPHPVDVLAAAVGGGHPTGPPRASWAMPSPPATRVETQAGPAASTTPPRGPGSSTPLQIACGRVTIALLRVYSAPRDPVDGEHAATRCTPRATRALAGRPPDLASLHRLPVTARPHGLGGCACSRCQHRTLLRRRVALLLAPLAGTSRVSVARARNDRDQTVTCWSRPDRRPRPGTAPTRERAPGRRQASARTARTATPASARPRGSDNPSQAPSRALPVGDLPSPAWFPPAHPPCRESLRASVDGSPRLRETISTCCSQPWTRRLPPRGSKRRLEDQYLSMSRFRDYRERPLPSGGSPDPALAVHCRSS